MKDMSGIAGTVPARADNCDFDGFHFFLIDSRRGTESAEFFLCELCDSVRDKKESIL